MLPVNVNINLCNVNLMHILFFPNFSMRLPFDIQFNSCDSTDGNFPVRLPASGRNCNVIDLRAIVTSCVTIGREGRQ